MSSKKTVLKVTPNAPAPSQQKVKRKTEYLKECINSIVKRELLHLSFNKVVSILDNDLHINIKDITPRLKHILYECLCYYMKTWPGWKKYEVVCVNERAKMDYHQKFKDYLLFKMNYIIENEEQFNIDIAEEEGTTMVSKEIQTDPISKSNKPEAPYNLVISGQPNVLNNIVFIETDSNIVIKQHAEKPWKPLNVAEFLNYSFVFVSIKLPDIELSRSNLHEFQRYITESGDVATCPDVDFITYIRKQSATKPKVYTMDYIHAYFKQFLDILRKAPGINAIKKTELEEIFRQFVLDIQESNVFSCTDSSGKAVNTMATDTSVCFNIGKKTYIRNKKMVVNNENQKETNAINFCEVLIPRMAYTLSKFDAKEDITTPDTSFMGLNEINMQINKNSPELFRFIEAVNNCITYQCLLCPKLYSGDRAYIDILDHYRFLHKGEQSVLCFMCRKQFLISKLAGTRWSHNCLDGNSGVAIEANNMFADASAGNVDSLPVVSRPSIGINDILASSQVTHPIVPMSPNIVLGISQIPTSMLKKPEQQRPIMPAGSQKKPEQRPIIPTSSIKKPEQRPILPKPAQGINEASTNTNTLSIDSLLGNQNNSSITPVVIASNNFSESTATYDNNTSGNATIVNTQPAENSVLPTSSILYPITSDPGLSVAAPTILSNSIYSNSITSFPLITTTFANSLPTHMVSDFNVVKTEPENVEPVIMSGAADSTPNVNLANLTTNIFDTNSLMNPTNYGTFTNLTMPTSPAVDNMSVFPPVITTSMNNVLPVIIDQNTNIMSTSELLLPNRLPVIVTSATTSELVNPLTVLTNPMSSVYLS